MPRTGSTLLLTGLKQHPEIVAHDELMHPLDSERRYNHAIVRGGQRIFYQGGEDDALRFLKSEVFEHDDAQGKRAVGFKLMAEHVRCAGTENLFGRMRREIAGLRVLHISRPNYLDTLISWNMAHKTRTWAHYVGKDAPDHAPSFDISPQEAEAHFQMMTEADSRIASFFAGRRYMKIDYDRIAGDYAGQMADIYRFLGVTQRAAAPWMKKQMNRTRSEVVTNYEALAAHFSNTPYGAFFR